MGQHPTVWARDGFGIERSGSVQNVRNPFVACPLECRGRFVAEREAYRDVPIHPTSTGSASELAELFPCGQSAMVPGDHVEAALSPAILDLVLAFVAANRCD